MGHREFKDRLYPQFARISRALSSEKRLEIVDVLAQAPRSVEALARETGMSIANVSQHLQTLRAARLVESEKRGTNVIYRLASPSVAGLWLSLRDVSEKQLAEVAVVKRQYMPGREDEGISRTELEEALQRGEVYLIDVRPLLEFEAGHLLGAVSIPIDELPMRLGELPRDRTVIAYCRGEYCLFADEAVALLKEAGISAARMEGGWPEWRSEGRQVVLTGGK